MIEKISAQLEAITILGVSGIDISLVVGLTILAYVISTLLAKVIQEIIQGYFKTFHLSSNSNQLNEISLLTPLNISLFGWIFVLTCSLLNIGSTNINTLVTVAKVTTYFGLAWAGWRFSDVFHLVLMEKAAKTKTKYDDLIAPLITKSIKVIIVVIGVLSIAEILSLPLASLIAGLGIGGIAIAMAAKDSIANVFGSIKVISERPFNIGDWIKMEGVEGNIESLGFWSTRVRTFYNSIVTIPNSMLLAATVDNLGARKYRRYSTKLGIKYDTDPTKIDAFCEGIRKIIQTQPHMHHENFHVYFNDFADSSLQIMLYCFFEVPDWSSELHARHALLLKIVTLAKKLKVEFAYPSQSLYLETPIK